jgi:hypothetical protein
MVGAELDEILERRRSAAGPVPDVVRVQEPLVGATRKPAAMVAAPKRPPQRRRDASRAATDRERTPVALDDPHHRGVATEPADSLRRQRRTTLDLRLPTHFLAGQRLRVDMDDELARVAPGPFALPGGERRPRDGEQRVGPARRRAAPRRGLRRLGFLRRPQSRQQQRALIRR